MSGRFGSIDDVFDFVSMRGWKLLLLNAHIISHSGLMVQVKLNLTCIYACPSGILTPELRELRCCAALVFLIFNPMECTQQIVSLFSEGVWKLCNIITCINLASKVVMPDVLGRLFKASVTCLSIINVCSRESFFSLHLWIVSHRRCPFRISLMVGILLTHSSKVILRSTQYQRAVLVESIHNLSS